MGIIAKIIILVFAFAALYVLARYLGLGRGTGILQPANARQIAFDALYGFEAAETVVGQDGQSALLKGHSGSYAIIQRHGAHFIAREFSTPVNCDSADDRLTLRSNIFPNGFVILNLGPDADKWRTRLLRRI